MLSMTRICLQARPLPILLISLVVGMLLISAGCSSTKSASNSENQGASIDTKAVDIPVEGLICVACAARIKQTLQGIDGVKDVRVDLEHRSVRVRYIEAKTSVASLVIAINGLGYKAGKAVPVDSVQSTG